MQPLTSTIAIDAPADRVWDIIAHQFGRIGEWATAIPCSAAIMAPATVTRNHVLVEAPVAGRVCDTGMRAVPRVMETIVAYDEDARTLTYQATAGMPAFVTLARNTWQVTPLSNVQALVSYAGELEARGVLGTLAKRLLLARVARDGQYLLEDLRHYAEHGEPSPRKQRDPVAAVGVRPTSRFLRAALRTNAAFSLLSGLVLACCGWWYLPLLPAGMAVAGFGLVVAGIAAVPANQLRRKAIPVIVADMLWVTASIIVVAEVRLPAAVAIAAGVVAAAVAVLAGWQTAGLAATRPSDPLADLDIIEASRHLPVPPHRVWPLLTDDRLYGRLAPNLSSVEVISQPGETLRRRCTSTSGRHWQETCTLWDEGRRYAVEVDTSAYPYPLTVMRGLWQVDPRSPGSTITMRFALQATPTIRGGLFVLFMRLMFGPALSRIFKGWEREALSISAD